MTVRLSEAQRRRVSEHVGLARYLARRWGAPSDQDEAFGWAFLALVEAAARFDPGRGVRFSTFAHPRIRGAVLDGRRRTARALGTPRGSPSDLEQMMVCSDLEPRHAALPSHDTQWVRQARARLPEPLRRLLAYVYDEEANLADAGRRMGISPSWASRLHREALIRLRAMEAASA
jgi:RNA polymerase sigma factor (sigma-70 family)